MSNDMTEKQIEEAFDKFEDTKEAQDYCFGNYNNYTRDHAVGLFCFKAGWVAAMEAPRGHWRNIKDHKPEFGQDCMVKFKHGFISGSYENPKDHADQEGVFYTYLWRDQTYFGQYWMPIEEFKELTGAN